MEKNGFPLSSTSALRADLWFLIQVLSLLTGAFSVYLLGCVPMCGVPLYPTTLRGDLLGVYEPKFFLGEWDIWFSMVHFVVRFSEWSFEKLVCEQSLASWELELSFMVDCFSLWRLLASPHYQFLQGGQFIVVFPRLWLGHPTPHWLDQLNISFTPTKQRWNFTIVY
jgi:hypothetical protein